MRDNEELRKLIEENPDLPLVFLVPVDDLDDSYGYMAFQNSSCYISEVYFYEDYYREDKRDVVEYYGDYLADEEEYKDLSDEEYEKVIEDYVDNNVEHYKAIVVRVKN